MSSAFGAAAVCFRQAAPIWVRWGECWHGRSNVRLPNAREMLLLTDPQRALDLTAIECPRMAAKLL